MLLVGIDGGGTKTQVVARYYGMSELCFEQYYSETNYQTVGKDSVEKIFAQILAEMDATLKPNWGNTVLVMGMAGIDREDDKTLYTALMRQAGYTGNITACGDAYIALVGAHGRRCGALTICGTGSIAVGIAADGSEVRSGGWGALLGDEGGGYRLGIEAIAAVMRAYDGSGPQTVLTKRILDHYRIKDETELIDVIYASGAIPVKSVATAAKIVTEELDNDPVCRRIAEEQLDALVGMIGGLDSKMHLHEYPMAVGGSLLTKSAAYYAMFSTKLSRVYPHIRMVNAQHSAVFGALIIAEEQYHLLGNCEMYVLHKQF